MQNMTVDQRVAYAMALDEIAYKSHSLNRWAISARLLMHDKYSDYGEPYLVLLREAVAELNALDAALCAALNAASVQHDTRETPKEAA